MDPQKYISYVRVSTKHQHNSGLGEEAQRTAIASFVAAAGATLLGEYLEAESGGEADRLFLPRRWPIAKPAARSCSWPSSIA
jgi:DNA invertase Pin-like site-specific DNA recombinase